MIVASIETWHDGQDEPVFEFEKEFPSREHLNEWLRIQDQHPFLWNIVKGVTEA